MATPEVKKVLEEKLLREESARSGQAVASMIMGWSEFDPATNDWDIYKDKLESIFELTSVTDDKVKVNSLIKLLGEDTLKLLMELCSPKKVKENSYKELCTMLEGHLSVAVNPFIERKLFYKANMMDDESVAEWYARVKKLAVNCQFGAGLESKLLDKFMTGAVDKIFDRLSEEKVSDLTLKKAYDIAIKIELKLNQKVQQNLKFNKIEKKKESFNRNEGGAGTNSEEKCYRCGARGHKAPDCKHKKTKCKNCQKIGHIAKACRSKPEKEGSIGGNGGTTFKTININDISVSNYKEPILVSLNVNGKKIDFELDSGAGVTAISEKFYRKFFNDCKLTQEFVRVYLVTGEKMSILGSFLATIVFENVTNEIKVVKNCESQVVGRDFLDKFNFQCRMVKKIDVNNLLANLLDKNKKKGPDEVSKVVVVFLRSWKNAF